MSRFSRVRSPTGRLPSRRSPSDSTPTCWPGSAGAGAGIRRGSIGLCVCSCRPRELAPGHADSGGVRRVLGSGPHAVREGDGRLLTAGTLEALTSPAAEFDEANRAPAGDRLTRRTDWPPGKETITFRLDADVLAWFRRGGRGYQTRINHVLRLFVQGQAAGPARRRQPLGPGW